MKKSLARVIVPTMLVASSFGVGLATLAPAGAATKAPKPSATAKTKTKSPSTWTGTVVKSEASKHVFWVKVGAATYRVEYSKAKFTAGSAALLTKGRAVTVTGSFVGASKVVVNALSIKA